MWDRIDSIFPPGNFTSVPELIYIYLYTCIFFGFGGIHADIGAKSRFLYSSKEETKLQRFSIALKGLYLNSAEREYKL
jgi:hypothetical protein